jgi:hypothetical protein
MTLLVS